MTCVALRDATAVEIGRLRVKGLDLGPNYPKLIVERCTLKLSHFETSLKLPTPDQRVRVAHAARSRQQSVSVAIV